MSTVPSQQSGASGPRGEAPDPVEVQPWAESLDSPPAQSAGFIHPADGLVMMVESEIIPRLMLAHRTRSSTSTPALPLGHVIGAETAETFARMVVAKESDSLIGFVGDLLQSGVSLDEVYMELLVPAARRLGEYWDEDSVSFTDVTVGLGRLQQVMRALSWKTSIAPEQGGFSRSAFFAPGPFEQHLLGLLIVEDFFRRAGWRTWVDTTATAEDLVDTVRGHWFDVFGLSVSTENHIEAVTANIQAIRQSSRNPGILILVGGKLFLDNPHLVAEVGADATASNGGEALLIANHSLLLINNGVSPLTSGA